MIKIKTIILCRYPKGLMFNQKNLKRRGMQLLIVLIKKDVKLGRNALLLLTTYPKQTLLLMLGVVMEDI